MEKNEHTSHRLFQSMLSDYIAVYMYRLTLCVVTYKQRETVSHLQRERDWQPPSSPVTTNSTVTTVVREMDRRSLIYLHAVVVMKVSTYYWTCLYCTANTAELMYLYHIYIRIVTSLSLSSSHVYVTRVAAEAILQTPKGSQLLVKEWNGQDATRKREKCWRVSTP